MRSSSRAGAAPLGCGANDAPCEGRGCTAGTVRGRRRGGGASVRRRGRMRVSHPLAPEQSMIDGSWGGADRKGPRSPKSTLDSRVEMEGDRHTRAVYSQGRGASGYSRLAS